MKNFHIIYIDHIIFIAHVIYITHITYITNMIHITPIIYMTHKYYISHTIKLIFKTYKKLVKYLFYNFFSICKNCKLSKYYQTIIKKAQRKTCKWSKRKVLKSFWRKKDKSRKITREKYQIFYKEKKEKKHHQYHCGWV